MVKDMKELEFTLLTGEQLHVSISERIFGMRSLEIFKKIGYKAVITDFAILLGGYVSQTEFKGGGYELKDRTGYWLTREKATDGNGHLYRLYYVDDEGFRDKCSFTSRDVGTRPAFLYSSISVNGVRGENGILEVEYGEYPQTVVSRDLNEILESAYSDKTISPTGKKYTTDSVYWKNRNSRFLPREHIEYEYNGKKYIRFVGDSNCSGETLSNGRVVRKGVPYWVEVEPIKWIIDEKADVALSKKILFAGVIFDDKVRESFAFTPTFIYVFMKRYFSKDIIPSKINPKVEEDKETDLRKAVEQLIQDSENQNDKSDEIKDKIERLKQLLQNLGRLEEEERILFAQIEDLKSQIEEKKSEIQAASTSKAADGAVQHIK